MLHVLAELSPLDPVSGERVTLRAASVQDRRITSLNDLRWWPAIVEMPALAIRLFDGDFTSDIDPGTASFSVSVEKLAKLEVNARRFLWAGAPVKLYAGEAGAAWAEWEQVFDGVVDKFEQQASIAKLQASVRTEPFEKSALTLTYAGTGGIEGGEDLKAKVKPWVFGRALNVEPILIDAVNCVYQFSAYGPIQAVNALYERASDFGAAIGDYADYAALVAADIDAGRWATCLAQGLVRLGAPAYGVITGDVDGDKPGGTWIRKTGDIIARIAENAGVDAGAIDSSSLAALDTAVPYNINLVLSDQTTVMDIARRLARPCNAQAGVSWLGKLFVTRVAIGSPALTLDAQGRQRPPVVNSVESDVSPPYWRIEMGAARCWRVQTADEIATESPLRERGPYDAGTFYVPGNWVTYERSSWRYRDDAAPGSGHAPPSLPATSNAWWELLAGKGDKGDDGAAGASAKALNIVADRTTITHDASGSPVPSSQTTTFTADKVNTAASVLWGMKDGDGNILNASSYLPNTSGGTVRNELLWSQDFSQSVWMADNFDAEVAASSYAAPDGTMTAQDITDSNGSFGATLRQSITITAGSGWWYGGVWVRKNPDATSRVGVGLILGSADPRPLLAVNWHPVTGEIAVVQSSGENAYVVDDYGDWVRIRLAVRNDGTQTIASFRLYPAISDLGSSGSQGAPTGTNTFWGAMLTSAGQNFLANYYAETQGSAVSNRIGDQVTLTAAQFESARGSTNGVLLTAYALDGRVMRGRASLTAVSNGLPGTPATSIVASRKAVQLWSYADGTVVSWADADGLLKVYSGATDVTAGATLSAMASGLTGTINTAANTPVSGQPKGYYQVTAMPGKTGTLTLSATYAGVTLTETFSVSKVEGGYEIVGSLPSTNLFEGRVVYLTTDDKLYRYTGSGWTAAVPAEDISGQVNNAQIAGMAASKVTGQLSDAQIADLSVTKLTGQLGGGNLCSDSSFEQIPTSWVFYNNGGSGGSGGAQDGGRRGGKMWVATAGATPGTTLGVRGSNPIAGGWQSQTWYVISFYARKKSGTGAGWAGMTLGWNVAPSMSAISNPALSDAEWRRYAYRIRWTGTPETSNYVWITANGTMSAGDEVWIDDVQIEEGEVVTAYAPRPDEILPSTITATEIADDAVTAPKIIAAAVVAGKIAANAVTSSTIAAGAITTSKLSANAVTANELAANAVTAVKISAGAVETAKLAAGAVDASKIAAGAVVAGKIAADAVTATTIATNAVTADAIAAGSVTAAKVASSNLITLTAQIADLVVTTSKIAVNSITEVYRTSNSTETLSAGPYTGEPTAWRYTVSKPTGTALIRVTICGTIRGTATVGSAALINLYLRANGTAHKRHSWYSSFPALTSIYQGFCMVHVFTAAELSDGHVLGLLADYTTTDVEVRLEQTQMIVEYVKR